MAHSVLITDLDNTLYNWKDFFATSTRAVAHALSRKTEVSEDEIFDDLRELYREHGTLEFYYLARDIKSIRSWLAKASPTTGPSEESLDGMILTDDVIHDRPSGSFSSADLFHRLSSDSIQELDPGDDLNYRIGKIDKEINIVWRIMARHHLKLYEGVKETLSWASSSGLLVIAVTNAPINQAEKRLQHLGLTRFIYGLAGWDWWDGKIERKEEKVTTDRRFRKDKGNFASTIKRRWLLRSDELKPNTAAYTKVLNDLGVPASSAVIIGDSLHKDIGPALALGAIGVWARYGLLCRDESNETLRRITNWTQTNIAAEQDTLSLQPTYIVDAFPAIRDILEVSQMRLPDFD
ncbi:MAG: HAD family hydrolase [Aggregatilineales bacterium]